MSRGGKTDQRPDVRGQADAGVEGAGPAGADRASRRPGGRAARRDLGRLHARRDRGGTQALDQRRRSRRRSRRSSPRRRRKTWRIWSARSSNSRASGASPATYRAGRSRRRHDRPRRRHHPALSSWSCGSSSGIFFPDCRHLDPQAPRRHANAEADRDDRAQPVDVFMATDPRRAADLHATRSSPNGSRWRTFSTLTKRSI